MIPKKVFWIVVIGFSLVAGLEFLFFNFQARKMKKMMQANYDNLQADYDSLGAANDTLLRQVAMRDSNDIKRQQMVDSLTDDLQTLNSKLIKVYDEYPNYTLISNLDFSKQLELLSRFGSDSIR